MWKYTAKSYPSSYKWAHYSPYMQEVFCMKAYLCIEIRKCSIYSLECIAPHVAPAQPYDQLAGMLCHMARHHDHVPDHGAQPTAPYLVSGFRPPAAYGLLPYHAQDIVCNYSKLQHQLICVKFTGRQTFQVHVCFYFTVELLAFSMCMVQADDLMVVHPQVGPPGVGFDVIWK